MTEHKVFGITFVPGSFLTRYCIFVDTVQIFIGNSLILISLWRFKYIPIPIIASIEVIPHIFSK